MTLSSDQESRLRGWVEDASDRYDLADDDIARVFGAVVAWVAEFVPGDAKQVRARVDDEARKVRRDVQAAR